MNIELSGESKVIMSNPQGSHNYFGWPTVVRLQNGTIAVGASGYRVEHICPFGKAVIAFSNDEGESYCAPEAVIDTVLDDRDAGLTVFDESGLIFTSFNNSVDFQRENMPQTDECFEYINSVRPGDEAEVLGSTFRISYDCAKTFSKIYRSPVTSPHGPIQLNDGSILWVGNVFDTYNRIEAYTINPENGQAVYKGRIDIPDDRNLNFNEPFAFQLPDGKIICHIRAENDDEKLFTLFQTVSYDNGKTWSRLEQIIKDDSGAPSHIFRHSSGVLIATFSRRALPYGIRMMYSTDGGMSWSEEFSLYENHETDDLGYPSTVELEDGSLLTVFYARDNEEVPAVIMQQKWKFV